MQSHLLNQCRIIANSVIKGKYKSQINQNTRFLAMHFLSVAWKLAAILVTHYFVNVGLCIYHIGAIDVLSVFAYVWNDGYIFVFVEVIVLPKTMSRSIAFQVVRIWNVNFYKRHYMKTYLSLFVLFYMAMICCQYFFTLASFFHSNISMLQNRRMRSYFVKQIKQRFEVLSSNNLALT